jgi:hypothetical protein
MEIATTCLQYLNYHCFDGRLTDKEISIYTYQGYYAFQDYAIAYWLDHLQSCADAKPHHFPNDLDRLSLAIDKLLDRDFRKTSDLATIINTTTIPESELHRITNQICLLRSATKMQAEPEQKSSAETISLQERLNRHRSIFEAIIMQLPADDPKRVDLSIFYGDAGGWFKCPKLQCFAFCEGFPTQAFRDTHTKKHEREFRCSFLGCLYATIGFVREGELKRHIAKNHPIAPEKDDCNFPHPRKRMKPSSQQDASSSGYPEEHIEREEIFSSASPPDPARGVAPGSSSILIPAVTGPLFYFS